MKNIRDDSEKVIAEKFSADQRWLKAYLLWTSSDINTCRWENQILITLSEVMRTHEVVIKMAVLVLKNVNFPNIVHLWTALKTKNFTTNDQRSNSADSGLNSADFLWNSAEQRWFLLDWQFFFNFSVFPGICRSAWILRYIKQIFNHSCEKKWTTKC